MHVILEMGRLQLLAFDYLIDFEFLKSIVFDRRGWSRSCSSNPLACRGPHSSPEFYPASISTAESISL